MRVLDQGRLVKIVAGAARLPKPLRRRMLKADGSLKLTVGKDVVAEFDSPTEEAEFIEGLVNGPSIEKSRGWRSG